MSADYNRLKEMKTALDAIESLCRIAAINFPNNSDIDVKTAGNYPHFASVKVGVRVMLDIVELARKNHGEQST